MKANEAPEKLYFGERDKGILDIYSNRESNDDIEYTRTDALEVKEVDLEKEYKEYVVDDPMFSTFILNDTFGRLMAKHFFELGLQAQKL